MAHTNKLIDPGDIGKAKTTGYKPEPYEIHEAVRTLSEAERIKSNSRLMREVHKTVAAVSKAAGGPPKRRRPK
jgi:hypothetical protein